MDDAAKRERGDIGERTEIVVSMTSFPARIDKVHIALESILGQALAPDRIVLCLSRAEFPEGESGLPESLRTAVSRGVELLWVDDNLKAHKKYFYTMQKYRDAAVITVDDDKIYPPTFVAEMADSYRRFPKCVTAMHAHLMAFGENGSLLPYAEWSKNYAFAPNRPDLALFAVGAGGVLYPPRILPEETFDPVSIVATCLDNDDIWLKAMELAGGKIPVVVPSGGDRAVTIDGSQDVSLWSSNKTNNDTMILKVFAHLQERTGRSMADEIRDGRRQPDLEELKLALDAWRVERDGRRQQKARADKAVQDYERLKAGLSSEIARHKAAVAASQAHSKELAESLAAAQGELTAAKCEIADHKGEAQRLKALAKESHDECARVRKSLEDFAEAQKALLDAEKRRSAKIAKQVSSLKDALRKLKLAKAESVRLCKEKSAKLKKASSRYKSLASSKLGRLTLLWWRAKKGMKARCGLAKPKSPASPKRSAGSAVGKRRAKGIRVLFPCGSGNNPGANPFVGTLMEALNAIGVSTYYGAKHLFTENPPFDIVHFMWPEAVFGWSNPGATAESLAQLKQAVSRIKAEGTLIAYTRHNTRPHIDDNPFLAKAYELIEGSADVIFHMGERSKTEFLSSHPKSAARNVVVPHHTYARISRAVTKKEAREWFGLSEKDRVVLSFGVFRSDEERELLVNAVRDCEIDNLKVLAPRFSDNPPPEIAALSHGRSVPEQALPLYFAAADVVFVQRCHILNSGNVSMAFHFGCACVGPDVGNVGEILKATGNPVFDPTDRASVARSLREAFAAMDTQNIGEKNRIWADAHWSQDSVAARIVAEYRGAMREIDSRPATPVVSVVVDRGTGSGEAYERTRASVAAQSYDPGLIRMLDGGSYRDGLAAAEDGLVLFLRCGDELTPGFLKNAAKPFRCQDVDCVVVKWGFAGQDPAQTHADKVVSRCEKGICIDPEKAAPLAACVFGRVFRASAIRDNPAICRQLDNASRKRLDLTSAAFSELSHAIELSRIYVSKADERYIPAGEADLESLLEQIDECPKMLTDESVPVDVKRAIVGRMQFATDRIYASIAALPEDMRGKACSDILEREKANIFFNRSLFSTRKAVAFCHNFPPAVDASSFVSAKRLREIDGLVGESLNWTAISQDMQSIRPLDFDFLTFFADIQLSKHVERTGKLGFAPVLQQPYADFAFDAAEAIRPEVIYSRAFFIGSHMAAYQYKKRHPEVKWYAEFSDPVAYAVDNTVRACPDKGPTWFDTEKMVYELADAIIFTNEKQRAYMLGYNPHAEMNDSIMRRSIIASQPVLPNCYCHIATRQYQFDRSKINIGYFGTFYMNRTDDDMLNLLENKNVVLHVFTTKPEEMYGQCARFGEQIRLNQTVSHLEFLNLGSRFDYLFLNDAEFVGGDNPFLPSKYADYMATGTKIIAKVQRGSTLSEIEDENLIKVEEITSEFAESL